MKGDKKGSNGDKKGSKGKSKARLRTIQKVKTFYKAKTKPKAKGLNKVECAGCKGHFDNDDKRDKYKHRVYGFKVFEGVGCPFAPPKQRVGPKEKYETDQERKKAKLEQTLVSNG